MPGPSPDCCMSCTWRSREVTWTPYVFAEGVDIDFISRVKELSLPGVVIEPTTVRQYHTQYAAHILGRVGLMNRSEVEYYTSLDEDGDGKPDYEMDDTVGKEGVEKAFESFLRGTPGIRAVDRNTSGKILSESWITEPKPGDNIVLTIDIDLQKKVEDTLASSLPNLVSEEVEGAACVVLDVNSFDVLASASYPTFDLANYSRDWEKNSTDPLTPLVNRALTGTYAPGSTFKMVTAIRSTGGGHYHSRLPNTGPGPLHLLPRHSSPVLVLPPVRQVSRAHQRQRGYRGIMQLLFLRRGTAAWHRPVGRLRHPLWPWPKDGPLSWRSPRASWLAPNILRAWAGPGTRARSYLWPSARRAANLPLSSLPAISPHWSMEAPESPPTC